MGTSMDTNADKNEASANLTSPDQIKVQIEQTLEEKLRYANDILFRTKVHTSYLQYSNFRSNVVVLISIENIEYQEVVKISTFL